MYGHLGILIEFWFTGFFSLYQKNWKMTGHTYLPMVFVYGMTALVLEAVSEALPWPFYFKALVYLPVIYGAEALSGSAIKIATGLLQKTFGGHGGGIIPWDYGSSRWTPFGLINFKYAPAWLLVALAFDPISGMMRNVVNYLAKVQ